MIKMGCAGTYALHNLSINLITIIHTVMAFVASQHADWNLSVYSEQLDYNSQGHADLPG